MILRNSILSMIRSKGKTALFTLLIFALTLVLALSISVWASIAQFLADCDDFYTTIGLLEYMGAGYPDDSGYDPAMDAALKSLDTGVIAMDSASLLWDAAARSFGYIEGFWRTDTFMPDRMLSVLVVGRAHYDEDRDVYSAIVMKSVYSMKSEEDTIILIDENFGSFELDRYYLVFGEVYYGDSPLLRLRIADFDNAIATAEGVEIPRMIDITSTGNDGQYYKIPADTVLLQVASTLQVANNSVLVSATHDLMSLFPFHQQELYFIEGRAFTKDEYQRGSRVAVISDLMAKRLGIGLHDTFDLSVAVSGQPGFYNSYWAPAGFSYREPFTVVGIVNTIMDKSWHIYVPKSAGVPVSQFPVGYTVGQAVIRNQEAAALYARMGSKFGGRLHLTLYDQGYAAVAKPYQTILSVARIVTAVCALVELAVVILFGFLFVYRQRETSETMLMLGSGKTRVCRYFLYSAGSIALIAAAAGAAAGYWLHHGILARVAMAAGNYALIDSRYSNGNLSISKTLEFAPELAWPLFLYVGAGVFLLAVLSCMAFTAGTFQRSRSGRQKRGGPNREGKTSQLGGGGLKYALLSILRGGARSAVVPTLAVTVVVFFGQLATTVLRYQDQLEAIYDNTTIAGYYTDINGKQVGGLVLDAYDVGNLYHSGLVSALSVSIGEPYSYLGLRRLADGTELDISPLYAPRSSFVQESMEAAILRGPDLTATNDIRHAPQFYYADTILMSFLDGFDESVLTLPADDDRAYSAILPTALMEEEGIAMGDTVRVAINLSCRDPLDNRKTFCHFDLRVVGSYEKQGAKNTIYAPLSIFFDTKLIWEEGRAVMAPPSETFESGYSVSPEQKDALQSTVLNSASFTLSDSRSLAAFKDYLAGYGYSQVQKISKVREFIVLKDAAFNNAVASVKQQIRYINTLYPCLYLLVGIIALVASYLLVVSRKMEFAIMRGLGATRARTFFSFFFEQSILCLLGTAGGLAVWRMAWGAPISLHLTLAAGFLACYFLGCAISILLMNRARVLAILLDKD